MARTVDRLTALEVEKATRQGMYHDGRGLYLHVGATGGKSWVFRYQLDGKARQMGLGGFPDVSLARARAKLAALRAQKADGIDPVAVKKAKQAAAKAEAAKAITFKAAAEKYIKTNRSGWRNSKHAAQWENTLATYAYPVIGDLAVSNIDTGHVTTILESLWAAKPETASRVRGRIESVLDYAKTREWRTGENPARWKGHLQNVLPKRAKVAKVKHHAALPWAEIGAFMETLRGQDGIAARALEYAIVTAARTGEVLGATWAEIDMRAAVWTVPGERMKAGNDHRVPLSKPALAVLEQMLPLRDAKHGDFVFPGGKAGKPLSNMAMLVLLRRMNRADVTAHGFRSSFRDWVAEATAFPSDVAEAALAHTIGGKVQQAYQRGDLFTKRAKLMDAWAEYCGRPAPVADNVTPLRAAG